MATGIGCVSFALYIFAIYFVLVPQFLYFDLPPCTNYDVLTGNWIILTENNCSRLGGLNLLVNRTSRHYNKVNKETVIFCPPKGINNFLKFSILTVILSGDVALNPGPIRFPCTKCEKPVRKNQQAIQCDTCDLWTRRKCTNISTKRVRYTRKF